MKQVRPWPELAVTLPPWAWAMARDGQAQARAIDVGMNLRGVSAVGAVKQLLTSLTSMSVQPFSTATVVASTVWVMRLVVLPPSGVWHWTADCSAHGGIAASHRRRGLLRPRCHQESAPLRPRVQRRHPVSDVALPSPNRIVPHWAVLTPRSGICSGNCSGEIGTREEMTDFGRAASHTASV